MPTPSPDTASLSWGQFQSHVRYLPTGAQGKIKRAFERGSALHAGQKRRSGDPYFIHPIAVAHILADWGADADTIIAALLHDALEDTPLSEDEIEEEFGSDVLKIVIALTKLDEEEFVEKPTLDEEIETIRKLFTAMQEDVRIIVIKLADRLHNMQTVEFLSKERQKSLSEETEKVYVRISDRLSMSDVRDELAELYLGVLKPELLEKLLAIRTKNERHADVIIGKMKKALKMAENNLLVDPHYEPQRFRKLHAQLEAGGSVVTGVTTLTVVFVCDNKAECYQTLGALHQLWHRETLSFADYINAPMINGYEGLHTTVILEDGTRIRCKIRTREMHEYARRGITTMCFDGKSIGLPSYMGWAERIAPLSESTTDRSADFWESLKSDILGESIVVNGPRDGMLILPEGSTALDGAFYFYGEQALRLKSVSLDGKDVIFQTPLEPPVTLEAVIGKSRTVKREWLQWVHTGLAATKIRESLAMEDRTKKIEEGKRLLEEVMVEKRRGLLAEFVEKGLEEGMHSIGFDSVDEGYIAIAEGRVEAGDVEKTLFETESKRRQKKSGSSVGERYFARFFIKKGDVETLHSLLGVYKKYGKKLENVRIWPAFFTKRQKLEIRARMSPEESEQFRKDVYVCGAKDIDIGTTSGKLWMKLALPALIVLWSLDCLFAKMIVGAGASPYDLTILRFGILTLLSVGYIGLSFCQRGKGEIKLKWISPLNRGLLLSVIALFCTALFTYISLQTISVVTYSIFITLGTILVFTPPLSAFNMGIRKTLFVAATCGLIFAGIASFVLEGGIMSVGALAGVGAGVGFALYSIVSSRYQMEQSIRNRYPIFILFLSIFALMLSLPFLTVTRFSIISSPLLIPSILFLTLFTSSPYILYYQLLKNEGVAVTGHIIPLFLPLVVVSDVFISGSWSWLYTIPIVATVIWALTVTKESVR